MRKIVSLFQRNYDGDRLVRDEVVPGAEWVLAGEGVATQKLDGTCCMIRDGRLYKRYEVKPSGTPPPDFEPANDVDEVTGKQQGWVPVSEADPSDRWHREALAAIPPAALAAIKEATFELVGPKIQGNPEGYERHTLVNHRNYERLKLHDVPRDFDGLRAYLAGHDIEGIVWHHPDGRMVKIKARDFGLKRKK